MDADSGWRPAKEAFMKFKVRKVRKTAPHARSGGKDRRDLVKHLKVCFGPCRCYATGKKPKEA